MASADKPIPIKPSFPFPPADPSAAPTAKSSPTPAHRERTSTNASANSAASRVRAASIKLMNASPPPGMWAATGSAVARAPTMEDIRTASFGPTGWNEEAQRGSRLRILARGRSGSQGSRVKRKHEPSETLTRPSPTTAATLQTSGGAATSSQAPAEHTMTIIPSTQPNDSKAPLHHYLEQGPKADVKPRQTPQFGTKDKGQEPESAVQQFDNGYISPPKLPWTQTTAIALRGFWRWFLTPAGFLITIYALNIVAWGGMLFLLLCNAAPAMCHPTCDDIQSPRRIWIEIDSQILNALFCVTGFGLAPWRFRDLYWWTWWRLGGMERKEFGIRRLGGIHRGWFRLPGSDQLPVDASPKNVSPDDPAVPIPVSRIPDPPPTGVHAPPTKAWKMDFVLWMNAWNTFFQVVLCFYMWHYNRYDRPSWATGLFVTLGCVVAGSGGLMIWHEGKCIKKVEGVPMPKEYTA
ncbi:hypothetical protein M011DRAFT_452006 [Sporormia fimetaria CBS 119925]|uniref:Uncharacterized protein n=1 Tax=Sporormia fimetaria CBS 119925 TaxID=1340428 RepID=A0A6A6UXJ6_9PLEO|nr:hypothetical protein M011DRAFT_452006 [Sporormia fimetaria CBS 119925]